MPEPTLSQCRKAARFFRLRERPATRKDLAGCFKCWLTFTLDPMPGNVSKLVSWRTGALAYRILAIISQFLLAASRAFADSLPTADRSADFSPQQCAKPGLTTDSTWRVGQFGCCCGLKSALRPVQDGASSKMRGRSAPRIIGHARSPRSCLAKKWLGNRNSGGA